jgi:hypothetical protein
VGTSTKTLPQLLRVAKVPLVIALDNSPPDVSSLASTSQVKNVRQEPNQQPNSAFEFLIVAAKEEIDSGYKDSDHDDYY